MDVLIATGLRGHDRVEKYFLSMVDWLIDWCLTPTLSVFQLFFCDRVSDLSNCC